MKNATSSAPHICLKVLAKIWPTACRLGPQDGSDHEPGGQSRGSAAERREIEHRSESGFCVIEETAAMESLNQLIAGRCDHGPVQATTTAISTR